MLHGVWRSWKMTFKNHPPNTINRDENVCQKSRNRFEDLQWIIPHMWDYSDIGQRQSQSFILYILQIDFFFLNTYGLSLSFYNSYLWHLYIFSKLHLTIFSLSYSSQFGVEEKRKNSKCYCWSSNKLKSSLVSINHHYIMTKCIYLFTCQREFVGSFHEQMWWYNANIHIHSFTIILLYIR